MRRTICSGSPVSTRFGCLAAKRRLASGLYRMQDTMQQLAVTIPTLRTERLRLRAPRLEDFPSSFAMWADARVTQMISGKPNTEQEVWARILRHVGHWCLLAYGTWVVEALDGGYVGEVGFGDHRREITPSLDGTSEMGWVLAPEAHGRGFASEASQAALAWKDATFPSDIVCLVDPANRSSLRVAEKLGFRFERQVTFGGGDTLVLRRLHPVSDQL